MARKAKGSSVYAGIGAQSGSSKEVNPTFSLKKAPTATPANGGKQVNPTFSANKSNSAVSAPKKGELNKTFAVAAKSLENSKGRSGRTSVAAKNTIGAPLSTKKTPRPMFSAMLKNNPKSHLLGKAIPTKNEENTNAKGIKGKASTKKVSMGKSTTVPTRNTSAPTGLNKQSKAPMTTARLKKLGY